MRVSIQLLHHEAKTPVYATDGAGAFDLFALIEPDDTMAPRRRIVPAGGALVLRTGVVFEVPPGHGLFALSRSGHGFNSDIRLANCVGLVDSDYRGEVRVKLTNDGRAGFAVNHGDRIAQAVILPIPHVEFVVRDELSTTVRGAKGFGSTGSA